MNSDSLAKLTDIFIFKYYEVLGHPNTNPGMYNLMSRGFLNGKSPPMYSAWMKYLENVGCRVIPKSAAKGTEFTYIDDPCYEENKIEVPVETARKILVLGLP